MEEVAPLNAPMVTPLHRACFLAVKGRLHHRVSVARLQLALPQQALGLSMQHPLCALMGPLSCMDPLVLLGVLVVTIHLFPICSVALER